MRRWGKRGLQIWRIEGTRMLAVRALRKFKRHIGPDPYAAWIKRNEPTAAELEWQRHRIFPLQPRLSIIVPTYNTPLQFLHAMVRSVLTQTYGHFDLCIADGGSRLGNVVEILRRYAQQDRRVKVRYLSNNSGIASNTNEALRLASGDYVTFLDHDDTLAPFALYEIVRAINRYPDADFVYADEDVMDAAGARLVPHFKPAWSPDLLRSYNYITHPIVLHRSLLEAVGGFRPAFDGSQDYDLTLRASERARRLVHIPQVLYHWRAHAGSVAGDPDAKPYAYTAARRALAEHLVRCGIEGEVVDGHAQSVYRVRYALQRRPLVSIIIPNRDKCTALRRCLDSVWRTRYTTYEVVIVENGSREKCTHSYYRELALRANVHVERFDREFNFAEAINLGVERAQGDVLLLLNNDTAALNDDWLGEMLAHALRPEVGAVGSKLYYPDGRIQHAGVIIGMGGFAGHAHALADGPDLGYLYRLVATQNLSAVTAACLMTRRDVFVQVGGMDVGYQLAYNDVDYCLKARAQGYLVVWTPYAELLHSESLTRGQEDTPEKHARWRKEADLLARRWSQVLQMGDPFFSPNLDIQSPSFTPCRAKVSHLAAGPRENSSAMRAAA
jgi:glycosyltransferase involved in cell wall biosynthesis